MLYKVLCCTGINLRPKGARFQQPIHSKDFPASSVVATGLVIWSDTEVHFRAVYELFSWVIITGSVKETNLLPDNIHTVYCLK